METSKADFNDYNTMMRVVIIQFISKFAIANARSGSLVEIV
jgi:hypothetical protein